MAVINKSKIQDISDGIRKILSDSPVGDVEGNINALLQGIFTKMELVNREEFDVQTAVLKRTREKLEAREEKLSAIEAKTKK